MSDSLFQSLSFSLPDSITFDLDQDRGSSADSSFFDLDVIDVSGGNNLFKVGQTFDAYCIDSDRGIDSRPTVTVPYTAKVYSSYDPLISALTTDPASGEPVVENPENLDLVNWIINQGFEGQTSGAGSAFSSDDIQVAIWTLTDGTLPTFATPDFNQARVDEIVGLAQANGEGFVPSYDYTNIFGEQVIGKVAVILVPQDQINADGIPTFQTIITEVELAKLGDFVFEDDDADGIQDAGESGIVGATVNLLSADGSTVIATTTTDADGKYQFEVVPGDYKVQFVQPSNFDGVSPVDANGNASDASDSDADPNNGLMTGVISLEGGDSDPTIDAGFFKKASLGDKVFVDKDRDGIQDAGEAGVEGVTVTLTGGGADGVIGTSDDTTETTTTDANGEYLFDELNPGEEYKVTFDASTATNADDFAGFTTANNESQGDALDSDADPTTGMTQIVTLSSGEFNDTLDAGLVEKTASLGDKVFVDKDRDGIQDAGEAGVEGVTVTLTGGGEDGVIGTGDDTTDSTTTDANGEYLFDGLNPGEEYKVTFDASTATNASDFDGFTTANNESQGDALDSDADPTTGMTQIVTLAPGEFNDTLDAGLVEKTASLGDKVFVDKDRDGIQDAGEAGVEGVTVTLTGGGEDGVIGTADDTTETTTTDVNGEYLFDGLNPGEEYKVTFDASTATNASDFDGFTIANNESQGDGLDSDADPTTGMTQIVTLAPGEFNDTLDAGLVEKTASLGDKVFVDADLDGIQDAGEAGVEGVTVTLTGGGADGVVGTADDTTETTTTDVNGEYLFDGLNPGEEYKVTFDASTATNADDFVGFTIANNESQGDGLDSDADPTTGMTQIVTLAPGEFNDTLDAGLIEKAPGIDIEKFVNGIDVTNINDLPEIAAGTDVTFTYTVTNTGNVAFAQADVIVTDDNGTAGDTSDDFTATYVSGDTNNNNFLDVDETWLYTSTTEAAQDLSVVTSSNDVRLHLTGNSYTTGSYGNTRTFTSEGVSVEASAFSYNSSAGWNTAYLGAYGGGLGVTNRYESGSGHRVDNGGSTDYVVFEFDQSVVVDRAFLDYVSGDSDISIWIGDRQGDITGLNDSLLNSFTKENNLGGGGDRWADFNNSELAGNTVIISAKTGSSNDSFKLRKLDIDIAGETTIGDYINTATVTAGDVSDSDDSGYTNPEGGEPPAPGIDIEKFVNGIDVTNINDLPEIAAGSDVTFTYTVDNTGNVAFAKNDIVVTDDNGTAGDTSDDFTATYVSGDANGNNFLDVDETWLYTSTTEAAQNLSVATASEDVTFHFSGNSYTTGHVGNVRNFSAGGVDVEVSAFSKWKKSGHENNYEKAYLGVYDGGLGVTNKYEYGSEHRVDNSTDIDYVVFEFDESVVVDRAFLKYVGHDSDATIWVGDRNGDITSLDNSLLNSFTKQNNYVNHGGDRWADFNDVAGNTVIISAFTGGSNDSFKIQKLDVEVAGETVIGDYVNTATVTAGGVSDSDQSGYTNPEAPIVVDPIHYEAEDMHLCNYKEKHINGFDLIQLTAHSGYATQTFDGLTGTYDVIVGYFDENDGHTSASVSIDGQVEASWVWNQDLGSNYVSTHNQAQYIIDDVHIGTGDTIKLAANINGGEYGRFDYVKIVSSDTISSVEEGVQDQLLVV